MELYNSLSERYKEDCYERHMEKYHPDYYDMRLKKAAPTDSVYVKATGQHSDKTANSAINKTYIDIRLKRIGQVLQILGEVIESYRLYMCFYTGDDLKILEGRLEGKKRIEISNELGITEAGVAKRLSLINKSFYDMFTAAQEDFEEE